MRVTLSSPLASIPAHSRLTKSCSPNAEGLFQGNLNVKSNADKCAPNQRDGGYPADCGNLDIIVGGCGVDPNSDAGVPAECLP